MSQAHSYSSIAEVLSYRAAHQTDNLALEFVPDRDQNNEPNERVTYSQFYWRALSIARAISAHGTSLGGQRIAICYPPGIELIAALFACFYAGACAVPMPPPARQRGRERWRAIVDNAGISGLLTDSASRATVEAAIKEIEGLDSPWVLQTDDIDTEASDVGLSKIAPNDIALLQYTSGSTGTPRGVMISHENLMHNLGLIYEAFRIHPDSRGVSWLPPYHDMGLIGGILQPIYCGCLTTLMSPMKFLRRPACWLELMSSTRSTTTGAPNFAFELCLERISEADSEDYDLSNWEVAFTGAERIRYETVMRFADRFAANGFDEGAIMPCYGLAESTLFVTGGGHARSSKISRKALAFGEVQLHDATEVSEDSLEITACGQSYQDTEVLIVDPESREELPNNQVGEVWVRSPSVAAGYWNNPDHTAKAFQSIAGQTAKPYLATGDLGFKLDQDLYITGRLKELIIIRGRNFYPTDIELAVQNSHALFQKDSSAAFAVDAKYGEELVLVHEPDRRFKADKDAPVAAAAARAAISRDFGLTLARIVFLKPGRLPRTSSGKIQRTQCRDALIDGSLNFVAEDVVETVASMAAELPPMGGDGAPNAEDIAAWIVTWMARRLNCAADSIDTGRPFAELGLDSAAAVELAAGLEHRLDIAEPLDVTLAWQYPTINTLAEYLAPNADAAALLRKELSLARGGN